MGRYFYGDIEGKFWFGIQPSDDALFFGGNEETEVSYSFSEEDLPDIKEGITKCTEALGIHKKKLKEFLKENESYNDEQVRILLGLKSEKETKEILAWYARYALGQKILKQVNKKGACFFSAEQ